MPASQGGGGAAAPPKIVIFGWRARGDTNPALTFSLKSYTNGTQDLSKNYKHKSRGLPKDTKHAIYKVCFWLKNIALFQEKEQKDTYVWNPQNVSIHNVFERFWA